MKVKRGEESHSVKLRGDLDAALSKLAEKRRRAKTFLLNIAVEEFLSNHKNGKPITILV